MPAPGAHHSEAFHEHGPILGCQFVPILLARVCNQAVHIGGSGLTCGQDGLPVLVTLPGWAMSVSLWAAWNLPVLSRQAKDQATWRWLLV
jgi:hypothetical protein